ncbi:hypothetical protein [Streptomyces sp. H27-D2]|uniref:hypothetical protein n=1 Tax=Streptomyces sp. H27-D2 TaxID=3046304 RepID=UPI002DB5BE96|nr:hypothetical protein [Streptomyces sp. H27-D2]MEC4018078.1 hypothetical protein [Streptomyces sp. H27-D2]
MNGPSTAHTAPVSDGVRWGAFSCGLLPLAVVIWGSPVGAASAVALGLAAVTTACRALLCRSERAGARIPDARRLPHGGHREGACPGAHRGGRRHEDRTPGE